MLESYILTALFLCFWIYLVQDAVLFTGWRNTAKIFFAKKMVSGNTWFWKFPNHWLHCPFCLGLVLNLCIVAVNHDLISAAIVPALVALIYKFTFK